MVLFCKRTKKPPLNLCRLLSFSQCKKHYLSAGLEQPKGAKMMGLGREGADVQYQTHDGDIKDEKKPARLSPVRAIQTPSAPREDCPRRYRGQLRMAIERKLSDTCYLCLWPR